VDRDASYLRITVGLVLGMACGLALGPSAKILDWAAQIILRVLGALAPALILVAVVRAIMTAEIRGRIALRMAGLLILNTTVAILVGLGWPMFSSRVRVRTWPPDALLPVMGDVFGQLLENIPTAGQTLGGQQSHRRRHDRRRLRVASRRLTGSQRRTAEDLVSLGFECILVILSWIIALVPLAVLGKVASIVGTSGFAPFAALGKFVAAVLVALALQTSYYLLRVRVGSWVRPLELLRGTSDALVMAFSTGSSTVTMPSPTIGFVHAWACETSRRASERWSVPISTTMAPRSTSHGRAVRCPNVGIELPSGSSDRRAHVDHRVGRCAGIPKQGW